MSSLDLVPIVRDIYAEWSARNCRAGLEFFAPDLSAFSIAGTPATFPVEAQFFATWTFDAGHVVRVDISQDRETGLAAATS